MRQLGTSLGVDILPPGYIAAAKRIACPHERADGVTGTADVDIDGIFVDASSVPPITGTDGPCEAVAAVSTGSIRPL
ncbi:MAG: hypothetical protein PVF23_02020 [Chromatiales bacterium]